MIFGSQSSTQWQTMRFWLASFMLFRYCTSIPTFSYRNLFQKQNGVCWKWLAAVSKKRYYKNILWCRKLQLFDADLFIKKYNYSLQNLKKLIDSNQLNYEDTSLSALYLKIKKLKLDVLVTFTFKLSKNLIIKNLTSRYCSLFLFDFYKLGYFCLLNKNKHV